MKTYLKFLVVGLALLAVASFFWGCATVTSKDSETFPNPRADENEVIQVGFGPLTLTERVKEILPFYYKFITQTEFVLCMEGKEDLQSDGIRIEVVLLARIEATSINSVRYGPCHGKYYLGTVHNHPPVKNETRDLCYQSEPDRMSFVMDRRAVIDIVLCGENKLRWWLRDGRTGIAILPTPIWSKASQ